MKYAYPAVFRQESDGLYSVEFPDLEGCFTSGETLPDAIEMAEDALCLMLYDMEEDGETIPAPSNPKDIAVSDDALVSLVGCDTLEYRKLYNNKAVKKTLTIPAWLNTMAERADLNFSSVLQDALKLRLDVQ